MRTTLKPELIQNKPTYKKIGYAYPSSTMSKFLGYYEEGTFYLQIGEGTFYPAKTKEDAINLSNNYPSFAVAWDCMTKSIEWNRKQNKPKEN